MVKDNSGDPVTVFSERELCSHSMRVFLKRPVDRTQFFFDTCKPPLFYAAIFTTPPPP
jgi:hypothetical protein